MAVHKSCPACGEALEDNTDLTDLGFDAILEDLFARMSSVAQLADFSLVLDDLGNGMGFRASVVAGGDVIARYSAPYATLAGSHVASQALVALEQAQEEIAADKAAEAALRAQLRSDFEDDDE